MLRSRSRPGSQEYLLGDLVACAILDRTLGKVEDKK
jgi:hypothetical protein